MGAAGDMITAALFELIDDKNDFLKQINSLPIDGLKVNAVKSVKCGICGSQMEISFFGKQEEIKDIENIAQKDNGHSDNHHHKDGNLHSHKHSGQTFQNIESLIQKFPISQNVKKNVLGIYRLIAEAEAQVHGKKIEQIHFHEVGDMDAITDIVGVCLLIERIAPEKIYASPINVGSGFVSCAHGILPVPAPATIDILRNVPIFTNSIKGELCTPTGAAILKYFVSHFGSIKQTKITKIGYGMGKKDFAAANCIRAFLSESESENFQNSVLQTNDSIAQLCCNLDDMTGEDMGFVIDLLLKEGANDVFILPSFMKKNRPGFALFCLCQEEKADVFAKLILKHTSTFGVRKTICSRYILEPGISNIQTDLGNIRVKTGKGYGIEKSKIEYEDIAKIAKEKGISIKEVRDKIKKKIEND
jgi:uncharacterized protein (TIGR00299 family) protein